MDWGSLEVAHAPFSRCSNLTVLTAVHSAQTYFQPRMSQGYPRSAELFCAWAEARLAKRCIIIAEVMNSACLQLVTQSDLRFARKIWFDSQQWRIFLYYATCFHILLLIPMREMWQYFLFVVEVSHYDVVMIMVGPPRRIPAHKWSQTLSNYAQQSSQANMWSSKRKQRSMTKGKRIDWGGCDLNPREGESHTEMHGQIWSFQFLHLNRKICGTATSHTR